MTLQRRFFRWWRKHFYVKPPFDDIVRVNTTDDGTQYVIPFDSMLATYTEPIAQELANITGARFDLPRYREAARKTIEIYYWYGAPSDLATCAQRARTILCACAAQSGDVP